MDHIDKSRKSGWNLDNSYARLPGLLFTVLDPVPVSNPQLVLLNRPLAATLGLDPQELQDQEGVAVLAGNRLPPGALPLAQAYAGHQFGGFTMLGDGRAHLLGEQITPAGERFDIQLKGSGPTPYSRRGDGRAALGPMLREYIISEAMQALGIPSSRSLAVVTTGETVRRETVLPGAVLTRVASSHLRVGTFQYLAQWGTVEDLRALADYALQRHFPDFPGADDPYLHLLQQVITRQARLISKWMLAGFIHGVMNTDNMTISGETIDYGPCAFMDSYHPATVFSSIDQQGRYAYGNQPAIALWNLARFAETLLPLLHRDRAEAVKMAQQALGAYTDLYDNYWLDGMRAKLGLFDREPEDEGLIEELLRMMQQLPADYTNTFLALTRGEEAEGDLSTHPDFARWQSSWQERLGRQEQGPEDAGQLMRQSNPALIPRNHRVEEALQAAAEKGDNSLLERLLQALAEPYAHHPAQKGYEAPPPAGAAPYRTFCGT